MSQNAMLDRETVIPIADSNAATETAPVARSQREHLTLVDWDLTAKTAAPTIIAGGFPPVVARRHTRYGWSEACVGLLMLASGAACVASLLNL